MYTTTTFADRYTNANEGVNTELTKEWSGADERYSCFIPMESGEERRGDEHSGHYVMYCRMEWT